MAVLQIQKVTKVFQSDSGETVTAVQDLNLEVQRGEIVVLVGESGSGKSTTLRLIAGLEEPTAGEILLEGQPMNGVPPAKRDVAMVFQNAVLYPHLSAAENLGFGLKLRRVSSREITERVKETADLLGIGAVLNRRPAELSGGQQQRVALGRAIIRRPKLFLLDEPLSQLDQRTRLDLRNEILRLHATVGTAMLYVTHDPVEATTLGHRIAVIQEGRMRQCASPREIYERPADRYVAGFLGTLGMNFVEGSMVSLNGKTVFREQVVVNSVESESLELPLSHILGRPSPGVESKVVLGVRPEGIQVCSGPEPPGAFSARIIGIQDLGSETHIQLATGGHSLLVKAGPGQSLSPGQMVHFTLDPRRVLLFHGQTGARMD